MPILSCNEADGLTAQGRGGRPSADRRRPPRRSPSGSSQGPSQCKRGLVGCAAGRTAWPAKLQPLAGETPGRGPWRSRGPRQGPSRRKPRRSPRRRLGRRRCRCKKEWKARALPAGFWSPRPSGPVSGGRWGSDPAGRARARPPTNRRAFSGSRPAHLGARRIRARRRARGNGAGRAGGPPVDAQSRRCRSSRRAHPPPTARCSRRTFRSRSGAGRLCRVEGGRAPPLGPRAGRRRLGSDQVVAHHLHSSKLKCSRGWGWGGLGVTSALLEDRDPRRPGRSTPAARSTLAEARDTGDVGGLPSLQSHTHQVGGAPPADLSSVENMELETDKRRFHKEVHFLLTINNRKGVLLRRRTPKVMHRRHRRLFRNVGSLAFSGAHSEAAVRSAVDTELAATGPNPGRAPTFCTGMEENLDSRSQLKFICTWSTPSWRRLGATALRLLCLLCPGL